MYFYVYILVLKTRNKPVFITNCKNNKRLGNLNVRGYFKTRISNHDVLLVLSKGHQITCEQYK